jgi:hypothetical protein
VKPDSKASIWDGKDVPAEELKNRKTNEELQRKGFLIESYMEGVRLTLYPVWNAYKR